ncbi:MAG: hypothetical protein LC099_12430 [Anaerolineales bacterium]|nr:hypothetical protein [Anaerolineales bacterium]
MATPKWNRVNYQAVNIPQGGGRQPSYDSPVNNVDLALSRFRDVLGDYGAIQDRKTGAELARRTMALSDPAAIREAIANRSLVAGLDPRSVTAQAYTNANDQISNLLTQRAADLSNRTGEFNLEKGQYDFGRTQRTNAARDALIPQQQQLAQLGTRGDVRGQGDILAGLDSSMLTPEALDILTKGNVANIGVPVRQQDIAIRGQDMAERNSIRNANARMAQVNQARQAMLADEINRGRDANAQKRAYDIAQLPESIQPAALESFKGDPDTFLRVSAYLDRYKQGKNIPLEGVTSGSTGSGRPRARSVDSESAADVLRDGIVRAPRAPISTSEVRAASLLRQAEGFDNQFPVSEAFNKAPANATEDQAVSYYLKNAGTSKHSEKALRDGWQQQEAYLKDKKLDKRFTTAEKLQLLEEGMEDRNILGRVRSTLFDGKGDTTYNIENVAPRIMDIGSGAMAANEAQRSNVTNQAGNIRKLTSELNKAQTEFSQLTNDVARTTGEGSRDFFNEAVRRKALEVGRLQEQLDNAVFNAGELMLGGGQVRGPKSTPYVPPSRQKIKEQFQREREKAERLRTTPTNIR